MRYIAIILLAALGAVFAGSQTLAHVRLLEAGPKIGSVVAASPSEVRLRFSDAFEPAFSGIEITFADGGVVPTEETKTEGNIIIAPLSTPLQPGVYRVNWNLLSPDGHKMQGSFIFEVRP